MRKDPIIEEVRKAGENLAREAGYNVHSFFNLLREREKLNAARVVSLAPPKHAVMYSNVNATACAENGSEYCGKQ
jgi:hypothetical protein